MNSFHTRINASRKRTPQGFSLINLFIGLVTTIAIVATVAALLLPVTRSAGPAARRSQCKNNLKQICLGLINYQSEFGELPPAYTVNSKGTPLHSWRTLILPYIDHPQLYDQIDLAKPWDAPENEKVASMATLPIYSCPSHDQIEGTMYLAVVSSGRSIGSRAGDGRLPTGDAAKDILLIVEVSNERAVHWMSPVDVNAESASTLFESTTAPHQHMLHAVFVDGSVKAIHENGFAEYASNQ